MSKFPTLVCGALACMLANSALAAMPARLPHIKEVVFSPAGDGTYDATVTGTGFGPAPAGIPCNACKPQQLEVATQRLPNTIERVNVTGWSDKEITVSGIKTDPTKAMTVAVWSAGAANAAAWGGLVSAGAHRVPRIWSIVTTGSGKTLSVTVTGRGFGPAPAGILGKVTDSAYFMLTDYNAAAPNSGDGGQAGGYPWQAGLCATKQGGHKTCNSVTVGYVSPTYGGGDGNWISNPGDAFCVNVWRSTRKTGGGNGGNVKCIRLPE
jgi:hypothetical protein